MANANGRQIFVNAGAIAHFSTGDIHQPLVGLAMTSSEQIHSPGHGFVVEGGQFTKIAPTEEIMDEYGSDAEVHDFEGRAITPGFVDAHTLLLWDGDRSNEIRMRQQGMSYSEIAAAGGHNLFMFARPRIAGLDTESVLCISIDLIWEFILGHFDFHYDAISRRVYRFYSRFEFQPFNL